MQSVYNQYFKNLLYCQPETTKRVVSCFSRLLNLVDEEIESQSRGRRLVY